MTLEIRQLPKMRLAYMRHTGPYGPALGALWERFGQWRAEHRLSEPRPKLYGLSLDNPACTPPEQCRYDACVQVGVGLRTGTDAQVQDFAGGDYACARFEGTAAEIGAAWAGLGRPGQIPQGWVPDARPAVEIYDEDYAMDPTTGVFACWLCMAVRKQA